MILVILAQFGDIITWNRDKILKKTVRSFCLFGLGGRRRVDKPQEDTILVALDRLRRCPEEIEGVWPPAKASKKRQRALSSVPPSTSNSLPKNRPTTGGEGSEKIAERTSNMDKVKRDETKKGGKKTEMKTDGSKKNDSTNSGSNENEMKKSEDSEPLMGSGKWSGRLRSSRVTPSARDV